MKNNPPRLHKKTDKVEDFKKILNSELVIKVKFYVMLIISLIAFVCICYLIQGPTYGYL